MDKPPLLQPLTVTHWERAGGSRAKDKPTLVSDALAALKRALDAIDDKVFDADAVEDIAGIPEARKRMEAESERRVKAAVVAADKVCEAVEKFLRGVNRKDSGGRDAAAAAEVVQRNAEDMRTALQGFVGVSLKELQIREKELKGEAEKDDEKESRESPERRRLKTRLIDQFRIVKMRPDQKVVFLLCVGNRKSAAFLGRTASDSNKPLLTKALKGDGNFKFYRGEVKWEEGAYTFVGPKMSATLARRIQHGVHELSGTNYRVRAHD